MAIDKKIIEILEDFGLEFQKDVQASLEKKLQESDARKGRKHNQSRLYGYLGEQGLYKVVQTGDVISFRYKLPEKARYAGAVNDGRKAAPVSAEGQSKMVDWAKRHNVAQWWRLKLQEDARKNGKKEKLINFDKAAKQIAFIIARNMKKRKLKGNRFFDEVLEDGRLEKLAKDLKEVMGTEMVLEFKKEMFK
jgi:hypothetical protein